MEALTQTTILFTIALTLSMIVERILEIIKSVLDLCDSKFNWHRFWTKRANVLKGKLERRLRIFEYANPEFVNRIIKAGQSFLLGPQHGYNGTVPTVSGDLVRALWFKIILKVLGIIIGIVLAIQFSLDLLSLWQNTDAQIVSDASGEPLMESVLTAPTVWGMILTGAAIGLGSGPMHKIIATMEKSWEMKKTLQRMKNL